MKYLGKIQDNKDLVTKEYVDNADSGKVDKVSGKGLSTNDYTTAEKNKLAGIAAGAQVNTITGVKGNSESSYRTGNVNLTAANVGAIPANTNGNTQNLYRPLKLNGANDNTLDAKINTLRANRLAFLPADQIIIEKTTDGGSTWTDAGVSDATKVGIFSETRASISIPLLNGVKSKQCGLRVTFTAMKYNVPSGTAETSKYNYWNSNYVTSQERYNQLKEMYFWISSNSDTIGVKLERATGAASTNWSTAFDDSTFLMTGWSGCDYFRFEQGVFGGGTNQTANWWNYRLTFMTKGTSASGGETMATSYTTSPQQIMEIRAYGDTWWGAGNEYAANDKIYTHDYLKNVTFPNKVTASGGFSGNLTGNATNVTSTVAIANGGTGATTASGAANNIFSGLPAWTADPTDDTYIPRQDTGGTASYGKVKFSTVWNYIKGKISSVLGLSTTGLTTPIVQTGSAAANYFQTQKMRGEGNADSYYHAIDFGYAGHNQVDFYEYGGIYNFHKHTSSAVDQGDTLLGAITTNGWEGKVNNHTVNADVPANAKFTDTVTTATTTGSGNAVTAISASNGALTVTKGTTFLTSHQDISGKADKSATVSTVTWDSTNKKLTKTINGTTTDVVTAATLRTGLNVADGAEVNQNAFSNVKVGSTTVAADSKTDTLELVAGSNVTLTPDATNDKVTIAATDTTYESKAAASGGTAVSLVTTGEKYTWNHKMSSIADVTNMELLTYEGTTNDVMTVGLHDDDATSKVPVVNATTGKIPASVYNNTTYESKEAASGGTAVSLVTTGEKYTWNNKQAALVSGTNIKTINNTSLLGSGNISVGGGGGTTDYSDLSNKPQINSNTLSGNKTSADLGLQSALSTSSPSPTVSATKGTKVSAEMRKYGNVIQFTLTFKNTSSVGSGSNVFEGTLSTNKPLQTISACGYYSSNALPMSINSSGSIVVRNAGSAAVTCSSNTTIGATWLV